MARIKALFKSVSEEDRQKFGSSRCLLTISVGQQTHEAEYFSSTIKLINASFAECVILVDDSLQRHNMALNLPEEADFFYNISIKEGDLWLERNRDHLDQLTIPTKIFRWDHWLKHPNFTVIKEKVLHQLHADPSYKKAFDTSLDCFLSKYYRRLANSKAFNIKRARRLSFDFVLEECVALCLWTELNCHYEVYPSRRSAAMTATHERLVLPTHPELLYAVGLKFKNSKQIKAQTFYFLERLTKQSHEKTPKEITYGNSSQHY